MLKFFQIHYCNAVLIHVNNQFPPWLGILERRKGGHAMKLTYFVSPYDLINQENRSYDSLNLDTVIKRKIGNYVTVCMEGSTAHKLPTSSIITVNRSPTGKR